MKVRYKRPTFTSQHNLITLPVKAHHIRNRTSTFRAIQDLQTERRWCCTGTPVQNSLDDLFALTEFLRFHPVENRQNARRWVLDPLGKKEEYAIENLQLLVSTVALRRSRGLEMKHVRSEVEVPVTLAYTERQQYNLIRNKAQRMIVGAENTTSAHELLSCILQMRQVCSHGLHGRACETEPAAHQGLLPSNTVCDKCSETFPRDLLLDSGLNEDSESKYCQECAKEESSTAYPISDSLSSQSGICLDNSTPFSWTGVAIADVCSDNDGEDMDLGANILAVPDWSSKIDSVVSNLLKAEQGQQFCSTPTKR